MPSSRRHRPTTKLWPLTVISPLAGAAMTTEVQRDAESALSAARLSASEDGRRASSSQTTQPAAEPNAEDDADGVRALVARWGPALCRVASLLDAERGSRGAGGAGAGRINLHLEKLPQPDRSGRQSRRRGTSTLDQPKAALPHCGASGGCGLDALSAWERAGAPEQDAETGTAELEDDGGAPVGSASWLQLWPESLLPPSTSASAEAIFALLPELCGAPRTDQTAPPTTRPASASAPPSDAGPPPPSPAALGGGDAPPTQRSRIEPRGDEAAWQPSRPAGVHAASATSPPSALPASPLSREPSLPASEDEWDWRVSEPTHGEPASPQSAQPGAEAVHAAKRRARRAVVIDSDDERDAFEQGGATQYRPTAHAPLPRSSSPPGLSIAIQDGDGRPTRTDGDARGPASLHPPSSECASPSVRARAHGSPLATRHAATEEGRATADAERPGVGGAHEHASLLVPLEEQLAPPPRAFIPSFSKKGAEPKPKRCVRLKRDVEQCLLPPATPAAPAAAACGLVSTAKGPHFLLPKSATELKRGSAIFSRLLFVDADADEWVEARQKPLWAPPPGSHGPDHSQAELDAGAAVAPPGSARCEAGRGCEAPCDSVEEPVPSAASDVDSAECASAPCSPGGDHGALDDEAASPSPHEQSGPDSASGKRPLAPTECAPADRSAGAPPPSTSAGSVIPDVGAANAQSAPVTAGGRRGGLISRRSTVRQLGEWAADAVGGAAETRFSSLVRMSAADTKCDEPPPSAQRVFLSVLQMASQHNLAQQAAEFVGRPSPDAPGAATPTVPYPSLATAQRIRLANPRGGDADGAHTDMVISAIAIESEEIAAA